MIEIPDDGIVFLSEPHTYLIKGKPVPSVTQVIEAAGLGLDFSLVPPDVLKMAQSRGNAVHVAAALWDAGELDWSTVDPRIEAYVRAYVEFRRMLPIKTVVVEKRMATGYMKYNDSIWFAGTPDLIGFINGRRSVIDLKTGQNADAGIQTAGYAILWNSEHKTEPIHDRYALRLRKDGSYKLIEEADPDDAPAFLDALEYTTAKAKMGRWNEKYGK